MTDTPAVLYQIRGPVAWLKINRPDSRNALNAAVRSGLFDGLRRFNSDPRAEVLVLTGMGSAFCAGGDLKEMAESGLATPPQDFIPQIGRNIDVRKPTIAAVNGPAYAGGFLLAQYCDLCVAAQSARFAVSEVKVGRGAPWAVPLPYLVPARAAMELLLTGDPISAQRGFEIGLVNRVVPDDDLEATAQSLAETIAGNAPLSVRAAKQTVWLGAHHSLGEAYDLAEELWRPVYESEDAKEGPRAYRDNRAPSWKGR
jgi:enoyl-CoA hydratase/carnithine racemase